jgi:N-acetylated-alpha-linked acidic dipeptidase
MMIRIRSLFFAACFGALIGGLVYLAFSQPAPGRPLYGFIASGADAQRALETRWMPTVSADRIRDRHRFLTEKPHLAGSARDRELAEWTRDRWREAGLEDVQIVEHEVLLPWAEEVGVEMTAPRPFRASMKEDPVPGDEYSAAADVGVPYHGYSASGEVEAEVVYAGSGNPADYDWLAARGIDIKGRIALVRYSVPYSYRGFKALTAQQRGAAGILIYSDPADDGSGKGKTYPDGPWGNDSHIQRGAIAYDFMVAGDPLTPGWPSLPGAPRIEREQSPSLPRIMSAPLSARDARPILESLGGPEAPKEWQGGLSIGAYRVGPGPSKVRMRVRLDDRIRPIWTVTGAVRGRERPGEMVVVGNHRDAWIYGGVDPSSGSAALMELAETLGALAREGVRPRRTILFASWDAEEFTLTSSTEWGEQFAHGLGRNAVAYLNVDSAASGPSFSASAVPALNKAIEEAALSVRDPGQGIPVSAAWRTRTAAERGSLPTGAGATLVNNRLGSGSDYTVFLNFLGIPIADLTFDGPYGVYHSIYDNHHWVSRIGDPSFSYHVALVQVWGVLAMRLANADVLPLDYTTYAAKIREFIEERDREWASGQSKPAAPNLLAPAREAAARLADAADRLDREIAAALAAGDRPRLDAISRRLIAAERAFIDPEGIPGRPWYRHQIYAPQYTYGPLVIPGVATAIESRDGEQVAAQARRLASALDRAVAALSTDLKAPTH